MTLRYIFCELDGGGDLSLEKYIILKTKHYQNILNVCDTIAISNFSISLSLFSFLIYKISIYTKNRHFNYVYILYQSLSNQEAQAMLVIFNRKVLTYGICSIDLKY